MNIIEFIKRQVKNLFSSKTVENIYHIDTAVSDTMSSYISLWERMYSGKASWIDNDEIISLRLEQAIVREFVNITLNEMTASISDKRLDKIYQKAIENLNINLQKGLTSGAMVIKPVNSDTVQYIPQSAFIPIEYDINGKLTKVIFPEIKRISDFEYLIRLEYHSLDIINGLTITNRAFRSNSPDVLGKEILLSSVPEWSNLNETISYPLMKRQAFGYYVNPIANNIDNSKMGVSIFESARELIKKADIQFGRLDWEFKSGERRINADVTAFAKDEKGNPIISDRLYRAFDITQLFQEFSPVLRETNYINGLEEYKRNIEFNVGLSYGDISNPNTVEKTATEIKSAKKRKYNTVTAIQKNLKNCLDDLAYAFAFYNSLATSDYGFVCSFRDSILVDDETERNQDIQDLRLGIMRPEEYRAKWYSETLEQAVQNLPQSAEVIE